MLASALREERDGKVGISTPPCPTLVVSIELKWDVLNTGTGVSQCALPYLGSSESHVDNLKRT